VETNEKAFEPLPPVAWVSAPGLTPQEAARLLEVINGVRSGEHTYSVSITYDKQTKARPRIEGEHYQALPGVTCKLHTGTILAAPTNKKGEIYLRIRDAARAPVPGETQEPDAEAGWTCVKPEGISSFRVLPDGRLPGPVTLARQAAVNNAANALALAVKSAERGQ
jgi:hypothetical protein